MTQLRGRVSSVAANHSLTLQTHVFSSVPPAVPPGNLVGRASSRGRNPILDRRSIPIGRRRGMPPSAAYFPGFSGSPPAKGNGGQPGEPELELISRQS